MLYSTPPLHFHHTPLNATVADVTKVLSVSLDTLSHKVSGGGSEAALTLLKVLVILHLWGRYNHNVIPNDLHANICCVYRSVERKCTPEMIRWVCLTRLISGVSSTKAALPCTCLRKLSEYSTWDRKKSQRKRSYLQDMSTSQAGGFQEGGIQITMKTTTTERSNVCYC